MRTSMTSAFSSGFTASMSKRPGSGVRGTRGAKLAMRAAASGSGAGEDATSALTRVGMQTSLHTPKFAST